MTNTLRKKIKCPSCKTENAYDFALWRKGEIGYSIYFDSSTGRIEADTEEYYEMYDNGISCQCGYESEKQSDFLVEVE